MSPIHVPPMRPTPSGRGWVCVVGKHRYHRRADLALVCATNARIAEYEAGLDALASVVPAPWRHWEGA